MDEIVVLKYVWAKSGRRNMFMLTLSPSWRTSVSGKSAYSLGAVLLDEGLSVQNPTFLATLPECLQVVLVYLVALGHSVALVRAASLVRGNAGCGARGVDDGVLCYVL